MNDRNHGLDREAQIRNIAAHLGVADFVYTSPPVRKGSALREVAGDGLLIVGDRGAILQVKAREPEQANLDSPMRVQAWLRKNAMKARNQGQGAKRELERRRNGGETVYVCPLRAIELPEDRRDTYLLPIGESCETWPIIVVLDHSQGDGVDLGFDPEVFWITPVDWIELHRRLRSTAGLLGYVRHCLKENVHVALGHEAERYCSLYQRDHDISSSLQFLVDPFDFDFQGMALYRNVIEKVWPDDGIVPWKNAEEYRTIVDFLDTVPPLIQARAGRWFLKKRSELAQGCKTPSGLIRMGDDRLVYMCSQLEGWADYEDWLSEVAAVTTLRHTQAIETGAPELTRTMGIGVLVGVNTEVSYTFVLLSSSQVDSPLPLDLRASLEQTYGIHDHIKG